MNDKKELYNTLDNLEYKVEQLKNKVKLLRKELGEADNKSLGIKYNYKRENGFLIVFIISLAIWVATA